MNFPWNCPQHLQRPGICIPLRIMRGTLGNAGATAGWGTMNIRQARELLILLILADAGFIIAHLVRVNTPYLNDPAFSLEMDRGYSEVFQYVKEFWLVVMFAWLGLLRRHAGYGIWALLFAYLLLDDSFSVHERLGGEVASWMDFSAAFGLRGKDFGELAVSAAVGLTALAALAVTYALSSEPFRRVCRWMAALIGLLAFCGVAADMLHMMVHDVPVLGAAMVVVEDGGELLAMSLMCWYVYTLLLQGRRGMRMPR
jgi:hypothetical protein